MSYTIWGVSLLLTSLLLFASGEIILCTDPKNEKCKFKLEDVSPRIHGFLRPTYPRYEVLDLSNHALTRLISAKKNYPEVEATTRYPSLSQNSVLFTTPHHRNEVPYIDLNGVTTLILSNNSVTVQELMAILHDQRLAEDRKKHAVEYLDLSYLNINWLPNHIFEELSSIEVLKLNNNPIGNIVNVQVALRFLPYLKELDLSGCGLSTLPDIFQDFLLTKLDLSNNLFTTVPILDYLGNSLQKLNIDGNPLSVLDDTSFSTYYGIDEISAENCNIHTITGQTFSRNTRLSKLNLQNNYLHYLFPDDIPLKQTEVSLWNNPWDCTCRNLWLMKETCNQFSKLLNPHSLRCRTPAKYAYRPLHEVARELEKFNNCDLIHFNFAHRRPSTPSSGSYIDYSFSNFMNKNAITDFLIISGLLAIIGTVVAVVLIKKFYYESRQQIYRPLRNIFQHKDPGYLDEKIIHHM